MIVIQAASSLSDHFLLALHIKVEMGVYRRQKYMVHSTFKVKKENTAEIHVAKYEDVTVNKLNGNNDQASPRRPGE